MDSQAFGLSLATVLLFATSSISGFLLLGKRNYLLGALWLLLSLSGFSFLLFGLYGVPVAYEISRFCDEISKSLGIPIVATAGLMAVTHHYKPSKVLSIVFLFAVLAAVLLLELADSVFHVKQAVSVGMWVAFSIYLWYFARRLVHIGQLGHAAGVVVVLVSVQAVIVAGNVQQLAGGDEPFRYYLSEIIAAAFLCLELFFAYCAMERSEPDDSAMLPAA